MSGGGGPLELARWMVRVGVEDQDLFTIHPVRDVEALGVDGLAATFAR